MIWHIMTRLLACKVALTPVAGLVTPLLGRRFSSAPVLAMFKTLFHFITMTDWESWNPRMWSQKRSLCCQMPMSSYMCPAYSRIVPPFLVEFGVFGRPGRRRSTNGSRNVRLKKKAHAAPNWLPVHFGISWTVPETATPWHLESFFQVSWLPGTFCVHWLLGPAINKFKKHPPRATHDQTKLFHAFSRPLTATLAGVWASLGLVHALASVVSCHLSESKKWDCITLQLIATYPWSTDSEQNQVDAPWLASWIPTMSHHHPVSCLSWCHHVRSRLGHSSWRPPTFKAGQAAKAHWKKMKDKFDSFIRTALMSEIWKSQKHVWSDKHISFYKPDWTSLKQKLWP